jgi:nucleotide-binding universal stress UspA family protein
MPGEAKFAKIVVAFDGSDYAAKAARLAASLSMKFSSELIVVHVFSSPTYALSAASGMPGPDYRELEDAAREAGQKVLSRGVQLALSAGAKASGELLEAPSVVEAIANYSENQKADLIVVGTRGMTGFRKLLLGSVSSGLISHAHCPVLVAR